MREFSSGAHRDNAEGKGRYDLIPPEAIRALAKRFEDGGKHYGDNNWKKGLPNYCLFDSALRHLFNALEGKNEEDHLGACLWNVSVLIYNREHGLGENISENN